MEQNGRHRGFFGVFRRGSTYRHILYLLLAFPLSWAYFYALIGMSAVFSGPGYLAFPFVLLGSFGFLAFPLLLLVASWLFAVFERVLARWLLAVEFSPMAAPLPLDASPWDRLLAHLRNPVTWKSLAYLFVKAAFGIAALALTAALLLGSLLLALAPALYAIAIWLYNAGIRHVYLQYTDLMDFAHTWLGLDGQVQPQGIAITLILTALGIAVLTVSLHVLNGVAAGWGWVAQQMLGISPTALQLAEARQRAVQAEQGRRQLILDASHELRTPVATIRAHIDALLLLQGDQLPDKVRDYLGISQRELERLSALVDELLMLARADADGLQLDLRPVSVAEVVEEVYEALGPLAEQERQVTLVRAVAEGAPLAYADRDRLAQVLLNLVRNAITYTPAGGLVSLDLAAGAEPGTVALTVSDTGIGIPEDDLELVFERFYRTDASRARHTGGFGLGLSIVRDLVRAMGGTVVAERMPAGGSRFRVTLRAAPGPSRTS
jgi:signal transduction histidine kinase